MTEGELRAIEVQCHLANRYVAVGDVHALVAEVRRLREAGFVSEQVAFDRGLAARYEQAEAQRALADRMTAERDAALAKLAEAFEATGRAPGVDASLVEAIRQVRLQVDAGHERTARWIERADAVEAKLAEVAALAESRQQSLVAASRVQHEQLQALTASQAKLAESQAALQRWIEGAGENARLLAAAQAREAELRAALEYVAKVGCMQRKDEQEFWCKKDDSAHSCYCPRGIALAALARPADRLALDAAIAAAVARETARCLSLPFGFSKEGLAEHDAKVAAEARKAALEEAAAECDAEARAYDESREACDAGGNAFGSSIESACAAASCRCANAVRALAKEPK